MDYKATLHLPKTTFPMKGNLPQTEPSVQARWEEGRLYEKLLKARKGSPTFILHDGPPYANGDIHMGHALNKVLKDFVVRYRILRGNPAPFVPGWDCHGLPIEYQLMKELKVTKQEVDTVDFRRKARAYALKYVSIQRDQFKRLGVLGDWENPYLTLRPEYVAAALRVLKTLLERGFIYRARRPVNWCWSCETALAEAEVEYEQHTSPSIFVKFELTPESKRKLIPPQVDVDRVYLVIWTTTPWTLMGNVAVAVHPEFEYAYRRVGPNEVWVTAAQLPEGSLRDLGWDAASCPVEKTIRGKDLLGKRYRRPFIQREGQVVLADYVSQEEGTGLVHIAPGFGAEDYATAKQYGLEVLAPVDGKGQFVGLGQEVSEWNGQMVQEANPAIIRRLDESKVLVKATEVEHPYPHCWRCRQPIIFRATDQWFLKIEHADLRKKLLRVIEKEVTWIPPEGKERMLGMVAHRPDWCLSRQRLWGIPIPAVICQGCGKAHLDPQVIENFARSLEAGPAGVETDPGGSPAERDIPGQKLQGTDRWFTEPVTRWLPPGFTCDCGKADCSFERGTDILDVWFDSGVSHEAVLKRWENLTHPADLYVEGSDQHRGWFQVSLITGLALSGKAPYRGVLTHGFVVDGEGRKMSKSLGNVIAPGEVVSSFGADVLRLWVASADYAEDVRVSTTILSQAAEVYRKIRNTLRFCLANVSDLDRTTMVPGTHGEAKRDADGARHRLEEQERWILSQLKKLVEGVTQAYDEYAYHRVVKAVHEFCTVRLSNFYLDFIKDRLYTSLLNDPKRRSIQTALVQIAQTLIRLIAPILPMTAQEAWEALRGERDQGEEMDLALYDWPDLNSFPEDPALEEIWDRLFQVRDQAMKALEKARETGLIGDALEAELEIIVGEEEWSRFLESHEEPLGTLCIVSALKVTRGKTEGPFAFQVRKAPGEKCQRCWMRLPSVGKSAEHPSLCCRCVEVVAKMVRHGIL